MTDTPTTDDSMTETPVTEASVLGGPPQLIATACHEPFGASWARLDKQAAGPLVEALSRARDSHREAMARAALSEPPPADGEWRQRLMAYRHDVSSDVLDPFIQVAEHKEAATAIGRIFTEVHDEALSACEKLPEEVAIPWGPTALVTEGTDDVSRKVGKVFARVISQARHAGRERKVSIRALALRHLDRNVAPLQNTAALEAIRTWSGWWTLLEAAWADWSRATLPVLMSAEALDQEGGGGHLDAWNAVSSAAMGLDAVLETLSANGPHEAVVAKAQGELDRARGLLEADLSVAGSFLFSPRLDGGSPGGEPVQDAAQEWAAWHHQSLARLRLQSAVLALSSGVAGVQQRLAARLRESCLDSAGVLVELADRLDDLSVELRKGGSPDGLEGRLADVRMRAEAALAEVLAALPKTPDVEAALRDGAGTAVDALQAIVKQMPAELMLHELDRTPPRRVRSSETRPLGLQHMARQAFDALRVERVRAVVLGMLEAFEAAVADVAEPSDVVSFGFDAALEEARSNEPEAAGRAVELAAKALERAAEAVRELPAALEEAIVGVMGDVADEIAVGCEALLERVESGRMEARLLAARSRFANLTMHLGALLEPAAQRWLRVLRLAWARARRGAEALFRRGSAIVGSEPVTVARSVRTVRALANADDLLRSLPLVYQRLFSFEPLSDDTLMAGREREMADALARWNDPRNEGRIPLLVVGRAGSGVTSLLNAMIEKLRGAGAKVAALSFGERITVESELACRLASTLGLGTMESMDDLAGRVSRTLEGSVPDVVVLDDLEHVYLRVPGGTTLFERLLTFMAETQRRVFWVGGISTSAWQLTEKVEPAAGGQVDTLGLGVLTADACRQAVLLRHRRSGLDVSYEEPREGRHLLKRRLRRLRGTRTHQEILEADFFDRLHRTSLGHLNLALFQWLAAADFESTDGVYMHPPARPDFSVLDSLNLTQNFSLKAFIEHRTLTLGEHDAIFRIPRRESYQILESLENRHLLEPVDGKRRGQADGEIVEGMRYRIPPLLTGAVIAHLQTRNIIH